MLADGARGGQKRIIDEIIAIPIARTIAPTKYLLKLPDLMFLAFDFDC